MLALYCYAAWAFIKIGWYKMAEKVFLWPRKKKTFFFFLKPHETKEWLNKEVCRLYELIVRILWSRWRHFEESKPKEIRMRMLSGTSCASQRCLFNRVVHPRLKVHSFSPQHDVDEGSGDIFYPTSTNSTQWNPPNDNMSPYYFWWCHPKAS